MGFSNDGDVIFRYKNDNQGVDQSFSVSVKKYIGHDKTKPRINRRDVNMTQLTKEEHYDQENSEGPYIFKPEWRNPLPQGFGQLDTNVIYERGQFLDQWTMILNDEATKEKALIKVRKTDSDLIEFDVELAPLPSTDGQSRDVIVTWKMYNGFKANKKFWTDSNSLAMVERNVEEFNNQVETIAGNYFPVNSAIAMRNSDSNI